MTDREGQTISAWVRAGGRLLLVGEGRAFLLRARPLRAVTLLCIALDGCGSRVALLGRHAHDLGAGGFDLCEVLPRSVLDAADAALERPRDFRDRFVEGAVRGGLLRTLDVAEPEEGRLARRGVRPLGAGLRSADRREIGLERCPHATHRAHGDGPQHEERGDRERERAEHREACGRSPALGVEQRRCAADAGVEP